MTTSTKPVFQPHSRLRQQPASALDDYYAGRKVWGDDFNLEEIREWYQMEEHACYEIYQAQGQIEQGSMPNNDYLHLKYGFEPALAGRSTLGNTLGMGSGTGEEFRPVRKQIEHLHIVESADGYFHNDAHTTYAKAQADGTLLFDPEFFDTVVNIAVLHHIPNLTHMLHEIHRVLKTGGICLIKEPITTLGPWHIPRKPGLAPCERGFPRELLEEIVRQAGFDVVRRTYFEFPPLRHVRDRGGINTYNSAFWTTLDQICCALTDWNYRYHRTRWYQKLAPSYVFLVLRKRPTSPKSAASAS